jgi:hypothetical protein
MTKASDRIDPLGRAAALLLLTALAASAHLGSPDVFYDGMVGPYPARIVIRMPNVVPGRAEISARVQTANPVQVSFLPLYARTAISNAPPPDPGLLVRGETNLYTGDLWLMSFGAYSINVRIRGEAGEGSVEIPVTSVATRQLPLPSWLGKLLLVLGAILIFGGLAIVAAAARESTLTPGLAPGTGERHKGIIAASIAALILVLALSGGRKWWAVEERSFRRHLREGAWPDLAAEIRTEGAQRVLRIDLGKEELSRDSFISLLPDHGKLLHLFLVREPDRDVLAHLHPIRKAGKTFEAALPPVPAGNYRLFCDLTLEGSGMSSTATNSVQIPSISEKPGGQNVLEPDLDDSWAATAPSPGSNVFHLPGGLQVGWKRKEPLHAKEDAGLTFQLRDAAGQPVELEPYMGMLCHAAVLRSDATVFAHLHPAGNYSMAAQAFFEDKLRREKGTGENESAAPMDHSKMGHGSHHGHSTSATSEVYIPYEFPTAGNYRIWLQFKVQGQVLTAVFDATVF